MSSDPSILLRMLEPAVRPGALPGGSPPRPTQPPFESQSFEELLGAAKEQATTARPGAQETQQAKPADPLASLADPGRVENVTLRDVLARIRMANG